MNCFFNKIIMNLLTLVERYDVDIFQYMSYYTLCICRQVCSNDTWNHLINKYKPEPILKLGETHICYLKDIHFVKIGKYFSNIISIENILCDCHGHGRYLTLKNKDIGIVDHRGLWLFTWMEFEINNISFSLGELNELQLGVRPSHTMLKLSLLQNTRYCSGNILPYYKLRPLVPHVAHNTEAYLKRTFRTSKIGGNLLIYDIALV